MFPGWALTTLLQLLSSCLHRLLVKRTGQRHVITWLGADATGAAVNPQVVAYWPPQRYVRSWLGTLVLCDGETKDVRVEVRDRVKIVRKDLHPQRHLQDQMFAYRCILIWLIGR